MPAALVTRLHADGTLDGLFGNSGSTWIELPSDYGLDPVIHDMSVLTDGRILAAGGDSRWSYRGRPFLARLLGNTGGGPGVLGVREPQINADEQSHEAVIPVRRMAGASGEVSVRYQITAASLDSGLPPATPGVDFTPVTGRVTWRDGETRTRKSGCQYFPTMKSPRAARAFHAGARRCARSGGARDAQCHRSRLAGPSIPPADSSSPLRRPVFRNSASTAEVWIYRGFYAAGQVSVTVTPISGTATAGDDFVPDPITVSWSDKDSDSKLVRIPIRHHDGTGQSGNDSPYSCPIPPEGRS